MLKVIIINDKGSYDITNLVEKITWTGDIKQSGRKVSVTFFNTKFNPMMQGFDIRAGNNIKIYEDDKMFFSGKIKLINTNSSEASIEATAYDVGSELLRKVSFNLSNGKIKDVPRLVCNQLGLNLGLVQDGNLEISKLFNTVSGYDAIMSAFTEEAQTTGNKYMIAVTGEKINVIKKGVTTLKITFEEKQNLISSSYGENIEHVVNRLISVDEKGNRVSVKDNKELIKLYGVMQDIISDKINEDTKSQIKTDSDGFKYPEKTCDLTGFGDISTISGNKVHVKDSYSGLTGIFYIDSDTHTWERGAHTIKLKLNFDNVMDEKSLSKEKSEGKIGDAKDWGHGITEEQLNKILKGKLKGTGKIFLKYCNMYKVDPALMAAIAMCETGNGTSAMANDGRNNFFGMKGKKYSSVEEGIRAGISNIARNYLYKGLKSISAIQKKYAPLSDSAGNANWIPAVSKFYKQCTGKDITNANLGTGVKNEAEAKENLYIYSSSSNSSIVNEASRHLGKHRFNGSFTEGLWCADFVGYCLKKSGNYPFSSSSSSCVGLAALYQKKGLLRKGGYIPKPGDTIFFKSSRTNSWTNHVGIVKSVTGTPPNIRITTIEGNTSDSRGRYSNGGMVGSHTYSASGASYARIVAYGSNGGKKNG